MTITPFVYVAEQTGDDDQLKGASTQTNDTGIGVFTFI